MVVVNRQVRIKFCGITRVEDAEYAVSLGAWAVGMIFWPQSPRACDPAVANRIAKSFRRETEVAGVFFNQPLDEVAELAETARLSLIQLHGDEGPAYCSEIRRRTGARIIKAARVRQAADVQAIGAFQTSFHLLDTHVPGTPGGTGETFDWSLAAQRRSRVPLILSGGLTAANVGDAIAAVRLYGVDVASGVELEPGIKDHAAMSAFSDAVKAAAPESAESDASPVVPAP
jgi:phosphoribosylanthranilate isomerase